MAVSGLFFLVTPPFGVIAGLIFVGEATLAPLRDAPLLVPGVTVVADPLAAVLLALPRVVLVLSPLPCCNKLNSRLRDFLAGVPVVVVRLFAGDCVLVGAPDAVLRGTREAVEFLVELEVGNTFSASGSDDGGGVVH